MLALVDIGVDIFYSNINKYSPKNIFNSDVSKYCATQKYGVVDTSVSEYRG